MGRKKPSKKLSGTSPNPRVWNSSKPAIISSRALSLNSKPPSPPCRVDISWVGMNRRSILKLPLLAAPIGKVKITSFEIHKVSVRWRDLLFVEVHTDAGITGLGEATLESRTDIAESVLRWLEPEYVGLDPAGPEQHW